MLQAVGEMLQVTKATDRAPRGARVERIYPPPFSEGQSGARIDQRFSVRSDEGSSKGSCANCRTEARSCRKNAAGTCAGDSSDSARRTGRERAHFRNRASSRSSGETSDSTDCELGEETEDRVATVIPPSLG